MKNEKFDLHFAFLIFFSIFVSFFFFFKVAYAKGVRTLRLNSNVVAKVYVSPRGTVLSFPTKPQKVILGRRQSFGLEYVENDITVSPLSPISHSNMFVYLDGRRFTFDLVTNESAGDDIIQIRDTLDSLVKVKVK